MRTRFKQSRNNWKNNQLHSFRNILMQRTKPMPSVNFKELKSELSSVTANRAAQLNRNLVSIDVNGIEN